MIREEEVIKIFECCIGEEPDAVECEGVINTVRFNSQQLELHRTEISNMLDQLPIEFKRDQEEAVAL